MPYNAIETGSFLLVASLCLALYGCDRQGSNQPNASDFPQSLERSDWPTYAAPCFLIQAPSTVELHSQWLTHDIYGINAYSLNNGKSTLLFELSAGSHFLEVTEPTARHAKIANLDAWYFDNRTNKHDSTTLQISTPLKFPAQILITHDPLNKTASDLTHQILSTIRINNYHPGYPDNWSWEEDRQEWIKMDPQQTATPILPSSARDYPCSLR